MKVDRARIGDAQRMHQLVNSFAVKGEMLPRALSEIYEHLRDYFVIRDASDQLLACGALQISWADLAEIRSLATSRARDLAHYLWRPASMKLESWGYLQSSA